MKILIDIAHPAHIHYFRNFAKIMESKRHSVLFTLRDKGIIVQLAKSFELNFKVRSKERRFKFLYFLEGIFRVLIVATKFRPDLYLDMGTVVSGPVAKLFRKPYIAFDDTEASIKARRLHMPFTDVLLTPDVFKLDIGKKQIRISSIMELMYLHKNYFIPDYEKVIKTVPKGTKYVLLRFVSWEAHHDVGQTGISYENKIRLIHFLSKHYKVLISSEKELPLELQKYNFNGRVEDIHHFLFFADLVVTEGATMASESIILGTPTIYINSIVSGNSEEQLKYDLLMHISDNEMLVNKVESYINAISNKSTFKNNHKKYLATKIDYTSFLVWFVENYPESVKIMKGNPDFQYNFK